MIADHWIDKWNQPPYNPVETTIVTIPTVFPEPTVVSPLTQDEINELRELLRKAKEYDEKTGQKECELESKKELLRQMAKDMGVNLELP